MEPQSRGDRRKLTRAFAPKVRTGCLTWIRRKKCDEEKPVCRRCRDFGVSCDGYATAPDNEPLIQGTGGGQQLVGPLMLESQQFICPDVFVNVEEQWLFRHFRNYTKSAFNSLGPVEFWGHHVVPLTVSSEPVRYAIIAVSAAHQLFLCRSTSQESHLECVAIQQYNKAIAHINTLDSMDTPYDIRCVLTCCLLFVCLESLSGRYSESIRHFRAGTHLLANLRFQHGAELEVTNELADMFDRFGIGISIFMEETILPNKPNYTCSAPIRVDPGPFVPFHSLNEASIYLRQIDVHYVHLMFSENYYSRTDREASFTMLEDRLSIWSSRFDETVKAVRFQVLSDEQQEQIMQMRLTQRLWQLFVPYDTTCHPLLASSSFSAFLREAEILARPFIAMKCRTFSVGGDLVGGLSLVSTLTTDAQIRSRALDLLRSLNRREGVWDSHEIIELHEATLAQENSHYWYRREVEGGIPGYMRALAGATPAMNLNNGILRMTRP